VRIIDEQAIKSHAQRRFRSEYDYALFEYYRSAKVFGFFDRAGVRVSGRVLDAGCGGGGMPLSLAEEADFVVGIDLADRFQDAGTRLAGERGLTNLAFAQADGQALPFAGGSFDAVLSHAVIEHVADAPQYLRELVRVLKPGGWIYLSTAPYLSFAGAHLPRLKVPVPLHLLFGRRVAFPTFVWLAKHLPWALREPEHENSFIKLARQNRIKHDDLLELVTVRRLRGQIAEAGLSVVLEHLHVTATFRNLPGPIARWIRETPRVQDVAIGNMEYVLRKGA
jgi:2-polyprenyl-3-methyl-5-hydroxy-6-metoxy-1,4-benzoquinol methylase